MAFLSFVQVTYWRYTGYTKDKQKEDKIIPFSNICANILLEAKTLCANHFFLNENRKLKWLHKTKIKLLQLKNTSFMYQCNGDCKYTIAPLRSFGLGDDNLIVLCLPPIPPPSQ